MNIYEPSDDSEFLRGFLKLYCRGRVLDMGCGSGILSSEAACYADKVIGVDINKNAIKYCKKSHNQPNIEFRESDLFSDVLEIFDVIICNPPYLPTEQKVSDVALDGGTNGYEYIDSFLKNAKSHLNENGKIILLYSSFTKQKKVYEIYSKYGYKHKQLGVKPLFFEKLYVDLLWIEN